MFGLFNLISDNFVGYYESQGGTGNNFMDDSGARAPDAVSAIRNGNYSGCEHETNRVACALELTAKAMSKTIRDRPYLVNGTQGTAGEAFSPVIHVRVT